MLQNIFAAFFFGFDWHKTVFLIAQVFKLAMA
jgi:hypothetical protein